MSGYQRLSRQGFQAQETLEHQLGIAGFDGQFDGAGQPTDGVLVSMLPDDVAVGFDLRRTFQSKTLLDVGPGQLDDDDIFVLRLVGLDTEWRQVGNLPYM